MFQLYVDECCNLPPMPSGIPQKKLLCTSLTDCVMSSISTSSDSSQIVQIESPTLTGNSTKILQMKRFLRLNSININEMKTEACSRLNFAASIVAYILFNAFIIFTKYIGTYVDAHVISEVV